MKKKTLKIIYFNVKTLIVLVALFLFKRLSFDDPHFYSKVFIGFVIVLLILGIVHYIFMRLIFNEENNELWIK